MRIYDLCKRYCIFICVLFGIFSRTAKADPLEAFIRGFNFSYDLGSKIEEYRDTSNNIFPYFESICDDIGALEVSPYLARNLKMEVISFSDKLKCVIPKTNVGQGIYCINDNSLNNHFVVAPHPVEDNGTGALAVKVFQSIKAKFLYISSISRCATKFESECSGKTSICGELGAYRISDFAHHEQNFLHALTIAFEKKYKQAVQIQIHACGEKNCPTNEKNNIISRISGGGKIEMTKDSYPNLLAQNMKKIIRERSLNAKVLSCNLKGEESYKLCASTNLQGRLLNGVLSNTCKDKASNFKNRFLHIETNYDLRNKIRNDDKINEDLLIDALKLTFNKSNK